MTERIPRAPAKYDQVTFSNILRVLEQSLSRKQDKNGDLVVVSRALILRDSNGAYWEVGVATNGTLTTTNLGTSL